MVERDRRASIATFYCPGPFEPGLTVNPSDDVLDHLRARRLSDGTAVRLSDGLGHIASATVRVRGRRDVELPVSSVAGVERPAPIHACSPVADRDRMLWLAEKATELGVASWRAVRFGRSSSVTPRGGGAGFSVKARARMISALEQSGGAWLPAMLEDTELAELADKASGLRIVLDTSGEPLLDALAGNGAREVTLLVGPEGGIEAGELALLEAADWRRASLGTATLRFETAAIAAIAVVRAAQCSMEA